MATKVHQKEKLFENLIIEGLKIYGHDVYYLPRTLVNKELYLVKMLQVNLIGYLCEMYMDTTEGFVMNKN